MEDHSVVHRAGDDALTGGPQRSHHLNTIRGAS